MKLAAIGSGLLALGLHAGAPAMAGDGAPGLRIEGSEFVLTREDGSQLRSAELIGAELRLPSGEVIRIDRVRRETNPAGAEVVLHGFSSRSADGSWVNPCLPDAEGAQWALPVAGHFADDGNLQAGADSFSLSCSSGAQAKCIRFGYAPWATAADGSALRPLYNACLRMVRADYCGDGRAHTRDGTSIDLYDDLGIQRPTADADFRFEAGWSPQGAVCVHHPRIADALSLERLASRCPRLADALGEVCTEDWSRQHGALLFNRSR